MEFDNSLSDPVNLGDDNAISKEVEPTKENPVSIVNEVDKSSVASVTPEVNVDENTKLEVVKPDTPTETVPVVELSEKSITESGVEPVSKELDVTVPTSLPPQEYIVKSGDTLSEIVEERLKETGRPYSYEMIENQVNEIAKANNIENPDLIYSGAKIELPSITVEPGLISERSIEEGVNNVIALDQNKLTERVVEEISSKPEDPAAISVENAVGAVGAAPSIEDKYDVDRVRPKHL